jgi:hypothetical protein
MILSAVLVLGTHLSAHLTVPVSDSVPVLNVQQVCQGIAKQGGVSFHDADVADEKKNCLDSEQAVRDQLIKQWSSFSASDKSACTKESEIGGESSYTELLTCLEMARDVRNIRNDADTSSAAAPRGLPTPTGHHQPTPQ